MIWGKKELSWESRILTAYTQISEVENEIRTRHNTMDDDLKGSGNTQRNYLAHVIESLRIATSHLSSAVAAVHTASHMSSGSKYLDKFSGDYVDLYCYSKEMIIVPTSDGWQFITSKILRGENPRGYQFESDLFEDHKDWDMVTGDTIGALTQAWFLLYRSDLYYDEKQNRNHVNTWTYGYTNQRDYQVYSLVDHFAFNGFVVMDVLEVDRES